MKITLHSCASSLYSFPAVTCSPVCTPYSTIGAVGLNFRVRHGSGCDPNALTTEKPIQLPRISQQSHRKQSSIGEKSLDALVPVSSTPLNAYTPGLSIRSSSGHLTSLQSKVSHLEGGFPLRCFQRLSVPNIATRLMQLAPQPVHQRFVHSGPLVLGTALLKYLTPMVDRDRTVSRRSKPSSRTALMGEQTNPWDLLQPQDAMSRHRGAKPRRR